MIIPRDRIDVVRQYCDKHGIRILFAACPEDPPPKPDEMIVHFVYPDAGSAATDAAAIEALVREFNTAVRDEMRIDLRGAPRREHIGDPVNPNYYKRRLPESSTVRILNEGIAASRPREVEIQVIDVIEAWGLHRNHYLATAIQYILRGSHKEDQTKDIKKAKWFLERWLGLEEEARP